MRAAPEKNRPANPATAFNTLLEEVLKVTRQEIQDAIARRGTRLGVKEQPHPKSGDPDSLSRTDSSN